MSIPDVVIIAGARTPFARINGNLAGQTAVSATDGNGRLRMTRGTGEVAQLFRLTALDLVLPFH